MAVVNPFRQLLNNISHQLTKQNLRSLIHICGPYVPEFRREEIKCGLDIFECLIHFDVIGEDLALVCNLLDIMREMRPKRKDIIRTVKQYIRHNYTPPLGYESSGESFGALHQDHGAFNHCIVNMSDSLSTPHQSSNYSETTRMLDNNKDYAWNCICFDCKCIPRRVPTCVLIIVAILFAILTIFVSIVWFAKVPRTLYDNLGDCSSPAVGGSVMGVLSLFTLTFFIWFIVRKFEEARAARIYAINGYCSSVEVPGDAFHSPSFSGSSIASDTRIQRYKKRRRNSASSALVGSATTDASSGIPRSVPTRVNIPPVTSTQLSYPDNLTDDGDTSLNTYGSPRSSVVASDEDSESPLTAVRG